MLWQAFGPAGLFRGGDVVGMKGLPGRKGIGVGHARQFVGALDAEAKILRSWIDADVEAYFPPEKSS
jgi:hypothetical protein